MLDGGVHFYDSYECADGEYVSLGSIEPQFYALLMEKADLDPGVFGHQHDSTRSDEMKAALTQVMKSKTQAQWCEIMEGTDVCFAPVLNFVDAPNHPANVARDTYVEVDGVVQPAPAPRFSRTPSAVRHGAHEIGADTDATLSAMGVAEQDIASLRKDGIIS